VPLKRAFMDFVGADKVWEYYGASEGGGTVIGPDDWLAHPGSVGRPFPGNEFVILDDDGNELPTGEVGTVWVKPAGSSFEYHNDAEKTAASHRNGFFSVGDAGYLDGEGYLYLADRKSDMVITGGVNVYPREIEEVLMEHPAVSLAAVIGIPHESHGEEIKAVVIKEKGHDDVSEADLVGWAKEQLAAYKYPRVVEFVDALPMTATGKILKRELS
jgi:long-chain acyl-CoA synthetase